MDDAQLVQAACGGDKQAFASIYDRYADRLHGFLVTVLRDRDEAADVLHDTFLDAGARLHQLRDPSKLRPWLFAIARHNAFRRLEAKKRVEPVEEVDVTATSDDPMDAAARSDVQELVASAAEGLSPRDRAVLDLHLRQGLEGQELGEAMGVSANHAYVLMNRLREQLQRALGALLVARRGSNDCEELAELLTGWDGRLTPLMRKRIARHTDKCEVCESTRDKVLDPAVLLAAVPIIPAPAALRDRVLGDVELVSHTGRRWRGKRFPGGRDGFPPPESEPARRARHALGAAALLLLLVFGGAVFVPGSTDHDAEALAAGATATTTSSPTTTTTSDTTATTETPGPGGLTAAAPAGTNPTTTAPPTTDTTTADTTGTTTSTSSTTSTTTTTVPPDTQGPTLGPVGVSPTEIWEAGPERCRDADPDPPRTAEVSVSADDPSGIDEVILSWGGPAPGSTAMTLQGGLYRATVGSFPQGTVAPGTSTVIALTIVATDTAGNSSETNSSVTLQSCVG